MNNPWEIYDLLIERAYPAVIGATIKHISMGVTWSLCQTLFSQESSVVADATGTEGIINFETGSKRTGNEGIGLAMSPNQSTRTLPWSGTLVNRPLQEITSWVKSWDPFEATVGLAAINSVINVAHNPFRDGAVPISTTGSSNLAVFEYFLPRLKNKKVAVIGRYPGLDKYESILDLTVLERNPLANDLPDPACEYVLPESDWVFITANSIANKTFPRLAELSRNAVTVLMGPSVPWLSDWSKYGIDFLAGVWINCSESLLATLAEGGGVRIFDHAVQYHVVDLSQHEIKKIKKNIADLVASREQLKIEMDAWYREAGNQKASRFPKWYLLEKIDTELSELDLRYKRQWDARHS